MIASEMAFVPSPWNNGTFYILIEIKGHSINPNTFKVKLLKLGS